MTTTKMKHPHCRSIVEKGLELHGFVVMEDLFNKHTGFDIRRKDSYKVFHVSLSDLQLDAEYHKKIDRVLKMYSDNTN